jgi:hypothetical protein
LVVVVEAVGQEDAVAVAVAAAVRVKRGRLAAAKVPFLIF